MPFDVVTFGAATQDVFLKSKKFEEIKDPTAPDGLDACLPLGAKINVDDIVFATGGGATNCGVTFARFGLKTACVARVGRDEIGAAIRHQLEQENISTLGIQEDKKKKSGYSLIIVSGSGHRAILTHRGASRDLQSSAIPWKKLSSQWIYISSLAGNIDLLKKIFAFAAKKKISIAWNPGNLELEWGIKKLEPFLSQAAIVSLNREEAAELAELPPRHLETILTHLGIFPKMALLVTDGQHGAYLRAQGETSFAPPLKAKRVNTTGAGDAFGSAFVATLAQGGDLIRALKAAMLNATSVITHFGAKAGILKKKPGILALSGVKVIRKKV